MRSEFQQQVFHQGDISPEYSCTRPLPTSNMANHPIHTGVCNGNGRLAAVKGTLVL